MYNMHFRKAYNTALSVMGLPTGNMDGTWEFTSPTSYEVGAKRIMETYKSKEEALHAMRLLVARFCAAFMVMGFISIRWIGRLLINGRMDGR